MKSSKTKCPSRTVTAGIAMLIGMATVAHGATRDPFLQPFSQDSIWNTPIGSNAIYQPANLSISNLILFDPEFIVKTSAADPFRTLYNPGANNNRSSGTYTFSQFRTPDSFLVPDATSSSQPNDCSAFMQPDGRTIQQLQPTTRLQNGGPIWGYRAADSDLYGHGIRGGHFGSGLSCIGGSLRKGELTGTSDIHHAIKIEVWASHYLYYSSSIPGYRWPASFADNYAGNASDPGHYAGTNSQLVQGALLAIAPSVNENSIGLTTAAGHKLFRALRDYGGYIVDDTAQNAFALCSEDGVESELTAAGYSWGGAGNLRDDINRLVTRLQVITNNDRTHVGGGGTPRVALADPLTAWNSVGAGALSRSGWSVWSSSTGSGTVASNMIDSDPSTRWSSGTAQSGSEWVRIDLGSAQSINRVWLQTPLDTEESSFPRSVNLWASNDPNSWGDFVTQQNGREPILSMEFGTRSARYLTIQQTGTAGSDWQIGDIQVFGPPSTTGAPIGHRIGIKAGNSGYYASSNQNNNTYLQASWAGSIGTWEKFDVVDAGGGNVALKNEQTGKYVTADLNQASKVLRADWATSIQGWETFKWESQADGTFALKALANGLYVSANQNDSYQLEAQWATGVGSWEKFTCTDLGAF